MVPEEGPPLLSQASSPEREEACQAPGPGEAPEVPGPPAVGRSAQNGNWKVLWRSTTKWRNWGEDLGLVLREPPS